MAAALTPFPRSDTGLRKIAAVSRNWLGLYGVRLSGSQLLADIPNPDVLHDPLRLAKAMAMLRRHGIVALLIPGGLLRQDDHLQWQPIGSGAWAVVDVRANGHDESGNEGASRTRDVTPIFSGRQGTISAGSRRRH
jgi:hypothetical protein